MSDCIWPHYIEDLYGVHPDAELPRKCICGVAISYARVVWFHPALEDWVTNLAAATMTEPYKGKTVPRNTR